MQQLLHEETIHLGLEAENPESAITQMVNRLPVWCLQSEKKDAVCNLLLKREKFGTTAIGGGVALPHCVADISVPTASLGISREGIPFPSLDGEPVHFIYMLVVPESEETHQLLRQNLHQAEKLFRDRFIKQRLRLSETVEEAYEIILRETSQAYYGLQVS